MSHLARCAGLREIFASHPFFNVSNGLFLGDGAAYLDHVAQLTLGFYGR